MDHLTARHGSRITVRTVRPYIQFTDCQPTCTFESCARFGHTVVHWEYPRVDWWKGGDYLPEELHNRDTNTNSAENEEPSNLETSSSLSQLDPWTNTHPLTSTQQPNRIHHVVLEDRSLPEPPVVRAHIPLQMLHREERSIFAPSNQSGLDDLPNEDEEWWMSWRRENGSSTSSGVLSSESVKNKRRKRRRLEPLMDISPF